MLRKHWILISIVVVVIYLWWRAKSNAASLAANPGAPSTSGTAGTTGGTNPTGQGVNDTNSGGSATAAAMLSPISVILSGKRFAFFNTSSGVESVNLRTGAIMLPTPTTASKNKVGRR